MSAVEGSPQRPGRGRDIYFELGRGEAREGRRARGAPVRVPRRRAGGLAPRGGRAPGEAGLGADALAPLAESVFAFIDELSARSAEGYAYEQSRGRRRGGRPPARPGAADGGAPARRAGGGGGRGPRRGLAAARHARRRWCGAATRELRLASRLPFGSLAARVRDDDRVRAGARRPRARAGWRELDALVRRRDAPPWARSCPGRRRGAAPRARRAALRLAAEGLLPDDGLAGHGPPPGRARAPARPPAARGPGRVEPGAARRAHRRARARACSRRCAAGSTTRGGCPTWRAPSTCIRRRSATG